MKTDSKNMDSQDWSLLICLSILWGGAFFFAGIAVKEMPPLTLVWARVALAALALLPLFLWQGFRLPGNLTGWWPFLGMGLLNNVMPFGLLFAGQIYISVGLASIINALTPLFTVLIMAVAREERLTLNRLIGVLLGAIGVAVLRGFDGTLDVEQTIGILLCMAGAFSYGLAGLWGRRHLSGVPPLKSATCQLLASTAILAVIVPIIDRPWQLDMPSSSAMYSVVALAIFATALAYLLFFRILVRAGASNAMLVTLLVPVTAIILGVVFLDETVRLQEIFGAVIIGIGLLFIDGRLLPKREVAN